METTLSESRSTALSVRWTLEPAALAAWLFPAALVLYLGMRSGGYDTLISDQTGIVAWWVIFLLLACELVPLLMTSYARVAFTVLTMFAAWNALSLLWTESAERTIGDVTLMLLYVALALLMFVLGGRRMSRLMLGGLSSAIVAIAFVALLSRLHFAWFSVPEVAQNLPNAARKLSFPIGYWNALADLLAMGVPLLLHTASGGRMLIWRAVAAAGVPVLVLCIFFTDSRGGAVCLAIGVVAFLALAKPRLANVAVTLSCGGASALLVAAANQRPAVRDGLRTALAARQGNELIAIVVLVAGGAALLVLAIALVGRHVARPRWLVVSRAAAARTAGLTAVVAIIAFIAAGGPQFASREWSQFKTAGGTTSVSAGDAFERFQDVTGNGRYQYWQAAVRAADLHPFTGIGAGTFIYWWAKHGTVAGGFVEDAHSLYLQALGELGYPGLLLISGFVLWILGCGTVRCMRARDADRRLTLAAATASAVVFAFSASVEWIWLIPALPASLFVVAAVIFSQESKRSTRSPLGIRRRLSRAAGVRRRAVHLLGASVALGAIVTIALPMAATASVRKSQADAASGRLAAALASARQAVRLQPYAASTWLQEGLVLELGGDLQGALTDAIRATRREPTNSNNWLVRSRLEARTGHVAAALAAYERARSLNPRSLLFAR